MILYFLAKYVDDLARNEPINVGVIAQDGDRLFARFDGEDEGGRLDLRRVRRIPASRTYRSWVRHWRQLMERGADADMLLRASSVDFYLEHAGSIVLDFEPREPSEVLDDLYARLVRPEEPPAPLTLQEKSRESLRQAGVPLEDRTRFKEHPEIEIEFRGVRQKDEVSYAVKNGGWHYLQEVPLDPNKPRLSRSAARNAAFLLEHAAVQGQTLALYDEADLGPGNVALLDLLAAISKPVNVGNPQEAGSELRELLKLGDIAPL